MTVINPNSISGITSITLPSGDGNVLTIHTNDGTERFRIDSSGNVKVGSAATISPDGDLFVTGVTTATTFTGAHSGSGANLTALPAANIAGTLPAISAANLTNVPAANITGTLPAISAANLTNVPAANLTGALPAISAASLTSVPAANIVGLATAGFNRSGGFGGRTISASASLNSTSVDFTGFSADTTRFDVIFRSASTASVDFGVRIGDSGGIEVSNYRCRSGFNRSSDNVAEENAGGFFTHGLAGSYTTSGFMTFISLTNSQHRWQCFGRFTENATDSHVFTVDGYRHLDGDLTQIRILPESGSFSGGEVHLVTYVD